MLIIPWQLSFLPPGVYLPLLWEQSFCWKSPIALGYTRGHFSALVAMENDGYGNRGAGANLNTDDDVTITFLPLVDSERKLLHVHFLSAQEVRGTTSPWTYLKPWCCPRTQLGTSFRSGVLCTSGSTSESGPGCRCFLEVLVSQAGTFTFPELLCRLLGGDAAVMWRQEPQPWCSDGCWVEN